MSTNNLSDYLRSAVRGIDSFIQEYTKDDSCLDYIYECDIQSELYAHIKDSLQDSNLLRAPKQWMVCTLHKTQADAVQLLHCEQNIVYKEGIKDRFDRVDIALWNPLHPNNPKSNFKHKKCLLLVEVKQSCKAKDALDKLKGDFEKLNKWQLDKEQAAIVLSFCTDSVTQASLNNKEALGNNNLESIVTLGSHIGILVCRDGFILIPES